MNREPPQDRDGCPTARVIERLFPMVHLPTVTVLALVRDISHDEAGALCATF